MAKYESMIFYRSFYEAIKELPVENQLNVYKAVCEYGLNEEEEQLKGVEKAVFLLIKPQIDANNKRKENGKKGAEYGKLGGRPKKENPTETPKEPQENPKITPRKPQENPTETHNVKVKVKEKVNVNEKNRGFVPPTLEEVKAYVQERNSPVNADTFFEYFTKGNWVDSKGNKVLNWKQKLITWEKYNTPEQKSKVVQMDFIGGSLSDDLLDALEKKSIKRM